MKNIKLILIGIAILFVAGSVVTVNVQIKSIARLKADNSRLKFNNAYLMEKDKLYTKLIIKKDEQTAEMKDSLKLLAKRLKTKPKFIDRVIYQTITEKDTVVREVPVYVVGKDRWLVSDTGNCFVWNGIVTLKNDSLKVSRTSYINENTIAETYYQKRKWFLAKRRNFVSKQPKCGTVQTVEFTFLK